MKDFATSAITNHSHSKSRTATADPNCTLKVGPTYLPTMIYLFWKPERSNAGDKSTSKYMAKAKIFISAVISFFYAMTIRNPEGSDIGVLPA